MQQIIGTSRNLVELHFTDGFKRSRVVRIVVHSYSTRVIVIEKRFETSKSSIS